MVQLQPPPTKEHVRIWCDDWSNDDEWFLFEHDSDWWILKQEAIKSREEAGDEVLGGGAGEGEVVVEGTWLGMD